MAKPFFLSTIRITTTQLDKHTPERLADPSMGETACEAPPQELMTRLSCLPPEPCGPKLGSTSCKLRLHLETHVAFSKKFTIWLAAATPALLLASMVCAPIFFLVKMTRFMYLSPTRALISIGVLGRDVAEVAEVRPLLEHFQQLALVHA